MVQKYVSLRLSRLRFPSFANKTEDSLTDDFIDHGLLPPVIIHALEEPTRELQGKRSQVEITSQAPKGGEMRVRSAFAKVSPTPWEVSPRITASIS